jgi:hypothetical protein
MDSKGRLQMIARITYYVGWLLALLGALAHFRLGISIFQTTMLPQRNLFEASVLLFLISAVSALRVMAG